jgi:hypothetical protein
MKKEMPCSKSGKKIDKADKPGPDGNSTPNAVNVRRKEDKFGPSAVNLSCPKCPEEPPFKTRSDLVLHYGARHGVTAAAAIEAVKRARAIKNVTLPFNYEKSCRHCDMDFVYRNVDVKGIRTHLLSHHDFRQVILDALKSSGKKYRSGGHYLCPEQGCGYANYDRRTIVDMHLAIYHGFLQTVYDGEEIRLGTAPRIKEVPSPPTQPKEVGNKRKAEDMRTAVQAKQIRTDKAGSGTEKLSPKLDKSSLKLDKTSPKLDKTSPKLGKTSTKSEKTSTKSDKTGTKSDKNSPKSEKASTKSDKTSTKSDKTSTNSDKTSTNSDKTSSKLEKTSTKSDKTSLVTEKITPKLDRSFARTTVNKFRPKMDASSSSSRFVNNSKPLVVRPGSKLGNLSPKAMPDKQSPGGGDNTAALTKDDSSPGKKKLNFLEYQKRKGLSPKDSTTTTSSTFTSSDTPNGDKQTPNGDKQTSNGHKQTPNRNMTSPVLGHQGRHDTNYESFTFQLANFNYKCTI